MLSILFIEMYMDIEEGKSKNFQFNCVQCGSCCRAGFEVVVERQDIELWIKAGKRDFYQFLQIDPKCISQSGLAGYHIEEINTLDKLNEQYDDDKYKNKLQELKDFILKNHSYLGKGPPLPIYTILTKLGRTPILVPKNLNILIEGLKWGLVYIIKYESGGSCPFLRDNLCSIHEIKPKACKLFPYNEKGELRVDDFFIKICKGLKRTFY